MRLVSKNMFQEAYKIASQYTYPLIIGIRFLDGVVESGLGSFVIINNEGWILTVGHNLGASFAFNEHKEKIKNYEQSISDIKSDNKLNHQQRKNKINKLEFDGKWITDFVILIKGVKIPIIESFVYHDHDIAFLRVDPGVFSDQKIYPKFRKEDSLTPGVSLCKLGYPFFNIPVQFKSKEEGFVFKDMGPIPRFPIEGIYTRNQIRGKAKDGMEILFLETSSPGLKGQSGGPIFDVKGSICAIQSQNFTLDMGFEGLLQKTGGQLKENQFLNLGLGVHPKTINTLLRKHSIHFEEA